MNTLFRLLNNNWWLLFGFFAQFLFLLRFFIQWLYSEKAKKVVVPLAFWYLSIVGGLMLFVYATHRRDPVFMLGQGLAVLIYVRNLILFYKEKKQNRLRNL